jgi:hypothetical protein
MDTGETVEGETDVKVYNTSIYEKGPTKVHREYDNSRYGHTSPTKI